MTIRRTFDASSLNEVANDPAVRPTLGGEGDLDLSDLVSDPTNFALVGEHGGFVLTPLSPGNLEVHSMFKPGRGSATIAAMRSAMEWVFTRTDCVAIWSKVPKSNKAAKGFARAGSLRALFERNHELLGATEFCEVPIMRWAMNNPSLETHGERFHSLLETAKREAGSNLPEHPHDAAHERAVGASLLMFERGQPGKGAAFYSLWARFAGYQPITLLSVAPVAVDVGDAILGLGQEGMEVLQCR
ncbi:hypothetical protein [Pelagerythrobacter sp.]|uniref:hypothetical protein n=1 Tax=Pelagerythrobacter sp. TaxID=2800702 RepID=UPI0035B2CEAA